MRPLPLRVWNERRTVISASRSSGFWSQTGKSRWILASSSRASSMNSLTSSGSACSASAASLSVLDAPRVGAAPTAMVRLSAASMAAASAALAASSLTCGAAAARGAAVPAAGGATGTEGVGCASSACTQAWALSSMYQGSRASGLQRLHVVLEADDGIGQTVDEARRQDVHARLHHALELSR